MIIGEEIFVYLIGLLFISPKTKEWLLEWSLEASGKYLLSILNISHWWHRLVLIQPCKNKHQNNCCNEYCTDFSRSHWQHD